MLTVYNELILDYFHYLLTWQQQFRIGTEDSLTLSLPWVINFIIPPAAPEIHITSHSLDNLAFHSLLRWKMIVIPILTTSCYDQGPEQSIYKCEMHDIV